MQAGDCIHDLYQDSLPTLRYPADHLGSQPAGWLDFPTLYSYPRAHVDLLLRAT
jgi:hypothetical protein